MEKYQQRPTYAKEIKYKNIRNLVNREIREAKKYHELELANKIKEDPKSFYAYIRSKASNKVRVGPLWSEGRVVADDRDMAEILNNYFSSVFTREDLVNVPTCSTAVTNGELSTVEITEDKATVSEQITG